VSNHAIDDSSAGATRGSIEVHAIDHIPTSERHGRVWQQAPFWFASNFLLPSLVVGFVGPLGGLGFGWTTLAIVLGSAIGTLFMALHASQGSTLGLPQLIQSRAQFGTHGVIFALLVTVAIYVCGNVFDVATTTQEMQAVVGSGPAWPWAVVIVMIQAAIAVCGFNWICRIERWLTYVIIIPFVVLTLGFIAVIGPSHVFLMGTFNSTVFFSQLAATALYLVAYVIYVSDYTRYLPATTRPGPLLLAVFVGPFVSSVWLSALGALFASTLKNGATLTSALTAGDMIVPGFGTAIMILAAIAQVVVMPLNTYGASLAALTAVDGFHPIRSSLRIRVSATLWLSGLILLIALAAPSANQGTFNDFLSLITYFVVPWSVINLVDYYWLRRRRYSVVDLLNRKGIYGRWSWRGLTAQAAGLVAMIPFIALPSFTGAGARALGGVDVSLLAGALVAGLVYYALRRGGDRSEDRAIAVADSRR